MKAALNKESVGRNSMTRSYLISCPIQRRRTLADECLSQSHVAQQPAPICCHPIGHVHSIVDCYSSLLLLFSKTDGGLDWKKRPSLRSASVAFRFNSNAN